MRAVDGARALTGLGHLLLPGLGTDVSTRRARQVMRFLGARQLVQSLVSAARPTWAVATLGAEVDALHAMSMAGLALLDSRLRRVALVDALAAAGFAVAGWPTDRHDIHVATPSTGRLVRLRDLVADRLARFSVPVPSWLRRPSDGAA